MLFAVQFLYEIKADVGNKLITLEVETVALQRGKQPSEVPDSSSSGAQLTGQCAVLETEGVKLEFDVVSIFFL